MLDSHVSNSPTDAPFLVPGWDHRLRYVFSGSTFEITLGFEAARLAREKFLQFLTGERTNAQWGFSQNLGSINVERTINFAQVSMLEISPLGPTPESPQGAQG